MVVMEYPSGTSQQNTVSLILDHVLIALLIIANVEHVPYMQVKELGFLVRRVAIVGCSRERLRRLDLTNQRNVR
jgi:hypothetical protein